MAKIILDVPEIHLNTVMTVLKSIKPELISNIQTQNSAAQPISSSIQQDNKYKKPVKPVSSRSRYISPEEFKKRLSGKA